MQLQQTHLLHSGLRLTASTLTLHTKFTRGCGSLNLQLQQIHLLHSRLRLVAHGHRENDKICLRSDGRLAPTFSNLALAYASLWHASSVVGRCAASFLKVRFLKKGRVCLNGIMTCKFGRRPLRGLLPQSARFELLSAASRPPTLKFVYARLSAASRPPVSQLTLLVNFFSHLTLLVNIFLAK